MKERVKAELIKRFENNDWNPITITMKYDGAKIAITPCSYIYDNKTLADIEYFMINCTTMNLCGSSKIDDIVEYIANYEMLLKENASDIEKCRQYWLEHVKNSKDQYMDDFYSDWHKDLFGYRPRRRDRFPA